MTTRTAVNPQTGERLQLVGGQWTPMGSGPSATSPASPRAGQPAASAQGAPRTAVNPQTGERLELVGGAWRPASTQPPQNGPQGGFPGMGGADTSPAYGSPQWAAQRDAMQGELDNRVDASRRAGRKVSALQNAERVAAGMSRFGNGATLGLPDRIVGEALNLANGNREGMDTVRGAKADMRESYPVTAYGSEIGGALVGLGKVGMAGGLPSQMLARAPGMSRLGGNAARATGYAADGAILAGAEATIGGRNPIPAAAMGGVLGPLAGKLGEKALPLAQRAGSAIGDGLEALARRSGLDDALARLNGTANPAGLAPPRPVPSARPGPDAAPTVDGVKAQARELYNAVDDTGAALSPDATAQLRKGLMERLNDPRVGFAPGIHKTAAQIMRELDGAGDTLSVKALRQLEQRAKRVTGQGKFGGEDAYAAGIARDTLRDTLRNSPDLIPGAGGANVSGRELSDQLSQADDLWRRALTAERIETGMATAERKARPSLSGLGRDRRLRSEMEKLTTGKSGRYLDADTTERLQGIAKGTPMRNVGQLLASGLDPTTGGMSVMLNGGAMLGTGGATLPLNALGAAAGRMATRGTRRDVESLLRLVLNGNAAPAAPQLPGGVRGALPAPALPIAGNMAPAPVAAPYVMAEGEPDPWQLAQMRQAQFAALPGR